jgi:mono/diheme cytochrome c family protein
MTAGKGGGDMRSITIGAILLALTLGTPPARAAGEKNAGEDVERFATGDSANGAGLYKRYCRGCHGEDGRGGAHTFMPHVGNLTRKDYIEFVPDSFLYQVIAEGGEAVGKNAYMPAWDGTLTADEIKDVIAYIRSLPTY